MNQETKSYISLFIITSIILLCLLCLMARADDVIETIAYEASNQPFLGQVYVAKVIQNRAKERNITPYQVVHQKYQFSCWKDGKPTQSRKLTDNECKTAIKAWEMALESNFSANLYHSVDVNPKWAHSKNVKKLCQVGSHIFYKEDR